MNVDVQALARQYRALPVFTNTRLARGRLSIRVKRTDDEGHWLGEADCPNGPDDPNHRICLYVRPTTIVAELHATLLHELVHTSGCWRHDKRFRRRFLIAACQAWLPGEVPFGLLDRAAIELSRSEVDTILERIAGLSLLLRGTRGAFLPCEEAPCEEAPCEEAPCKEAPRKEAPCEASCKGAPCP